ncbi:MAG TPA: aminoglycoside adenylyltransferase domain-containing protein [Thermomicrobiales bacterium]|nr:aminoglycoside adenylyltransferase domain-containing protein [Thermomicrobiales bacterium]
MTDHGRDCVFTDARAVLAALLGGLDVAAPGLITDVYITGSIALGDGRPGQSDLDVVLVRDVHADNAATMAALEPVMVALRRTHPRPMVDGIVLGRADLAAGPDGVVGPRPFLIDGKAHLGEQSSGRNPVTWQTLAQCGITWRGTPLAGLPLWQDPDALDAWVRGNLVSYWRPWWASSDRLFSRMGIVSLHPWFSEWGVLGVTRLHYTLVTGKITSKHAAGSYALETFPDRWHRILREAMRYRERRREGAMYRGDPVGRRRDARDYVAMVIADALGNGRRG